jgi:hypothetical protein
MASCLVKLAQGPRHCIRTALQATIIITCKIVIVICVYPLKLALTSPTSGGGLVGIFRACGLKPRSSFSCLFYILESDRNFGNGQTVWRKNCITNMCTGQWTDNWQGTDSPYRWRGRSTALDAYLSRQGLKPGHGTRRQDGLVTFCLRVSRNLTRVSCFKCVNYNNKLCSNFLVILKFIFTCIGQESAEENIWFEER